ncbi:sensor histidine kinase [Pseudooctadecabacter sp.]|uniref:sensor histidine kinase n=1 Tax=Pseudooctadecabacter sp. TaxID=1966338 RepID=UPI0035C7A623
MTDKVVLHRRLTARILLFLTLALVPLGIIGVIQNQRLNAEIQQRADLTLLALTEQAASGERRKIQRTFGAAQALAGTINYLLQDPTGCSEALQHQASTAGGFAFIGFIDINGLSTCSTANQTVDFSQLDEFKEMVENPRQRLTLNMSGQVSGETVLIFAQPHWGQDDLDGFVTVSVPLDDVVSEPDFFTEAEPITLITFNTDGDLLTTENDRQLAQALLPTGIPLTELATGYARTFDATSRSGRDISYSVVPIIPDVAYALGLWTAGETATGTEISPFLSTLLPFMMWLASLFVAWFVIDRFVVDRIKDLNRGMSDFAENRALSAPAHHNLSVELEDLDVTFRGMAQKILRDEATMEDQLREKSILLKEVHHRVRNNLQIISSIMNMQIRKAKEDETRLSLSQVQDRILGLSQVHQSLYQTETLTELDAADLIQQLVDQSRVLVEATDRTIAIDLDLDNIVIFPDQAVPLTMLVSECLSNAVKYIGGTPPVISMRLKRAPTGEVALTIENTTGPESSRAPAAGHITGLGRQLIRAFVAQLNGTLTVSEPEGHYRIDVTFDVVTPQSAPYDY